MEVVFLAHVAASGLWLRPTFFRDISKPDGGCLGVTSSSGTYMCSIDRASSASKSNVVVNKLSILGSFAFFRCPSRPLYCLRAGEQDCPPIYEYIEAMLRESFTPTSTHLTVFDFRVRAYHYKEIY